MDFKDQAFFSNFTQNMNFGPTMITISGKWREKTGGYTYNYGADGGGSGS